MNKKRYLKEGIEKNLELLTLVNIIMIVFSILLIIIFDDMQTLYNYYVKLYVINNIILLINGYILIKFTKKYNIFNK